MKINTAQRLKGSLESRELTAKSEVQNQLDLLRDLIEEIEKQEKSGHLDKNLEKQCLELLQKLKRQAG